MSKPLVSICLICYNQEEFILDALRGIAMQEIDFEMELLVADDCSTDNTLSVIKDFLFGSFIKNFRILERPVNLGVQKNWQDSLQNANGKYIAPLEGDDYWTDPYKLQKQVNFLEQNNLYMGSFHNIEERHDDDDRVSFLFNTFDKAVDVDFEMLCAANLMQTCSILYRRGNIIAYPDWIFKLKMVDWPLNLYHAQFGKFKYIPKVMGVHRLHRASIWTPLSANKTNQYIKEAYEGVIANFKYNELHLASLLKAQNVFLNTIKSAGNKGGFITSLKNRLKQIGGEVKKIVHA